MPLNKIIILAPKVKFPAGTKLGLDTKWATNHASFIKRIEPGYYEVTTPVTFPKGAVLWVDNPEKLLPKFKDGRGDELSAFEIVDMPVGYREENPADKAKREAFLKPAAAPAKGKKAA